MHDFSPPDCLSALAKLGLYARAEPISIIVFLFTARVCQNWGSRQGRSEEPICMISRLPECPCHCEATVFQSTPSLMLLCLSQMLPPNPEFGELEAFTCKTWGGPRIKNTSGKRAVNFCVHTPPLSAGAVVYLLHA